MVRSGRAPPPGEGAHSDLMAARILQSLCHAQAKKSPHQRAAACRGLGARGYAPLATRASTTFNMAFKLPAMVPST